MQVGVVGGGIVGGFAAFFLARAGAAVTVFEPREIGGQASGNNPGGLNPLYGPGIPGPLQPFALEAFRLHLEHWDEIELRSGVAFRGRRKQRLNLAVDEADVTALGRMKQTYDGVEGFRADWLDGAELRRLEPRLAPAVACGLLAQGDAKVVAPSYTRAVIGAARAAGATLVPEEVHDVRRNGAGVVVSSTRGDATFDAVVLATGPWCEAPTRWTGIRLPVEPLKGEMLLAEVAGGGVPHDIAWRTSAIYEVGDGTLWLGGTEDRTAYDDAVTDAARASILDRLRVVFPAVADAVVLRQTAGLRPVTADGLPIVGPAGEAGCYVALGGGRKGMLYSAAMGRAVADLVLEGESTVPLDACAPTRFVDAPDPGGSR